MPSQQYYLNRLIKKLLSWLGVGYFINGNLVTLAGKPGNAKLIIVSRSHYTEITDYISSKDPKIVDQILKLETVKHQQSTLIIKNISSTIDNKTHYTKWVYAEECQRFNAFLIPETLIMTFNVGQLIKYTVEQKVFYAIRSKLGVFSSSQTNIIKTNEDFLFASNTYEQFDTINLNEDQVPKYLFYQLNEMPMIYWWELLKQFEWSKFSQWIQKNIYIIYASICVYFFISASIIWLYDTYLESRKQIITNEIAEVFALQNKVDSLSKNQALYRYINDIKPSNVGFFKLFSQLVDTAVIDQAILENKRYTIKGETDSATQLMERLLDNKLISNLRMDVPIRKIKDKERFQISFEIRGNT